MMQAVKGLPQCERSCGRMRVFPSDCCPDLKLVSWLLYFLYI